jgi:hypothetical protein
MHEQSSGQFTAILDDGLYYYDGRNSAEMGAFSETYTRAYRAAVTQGFALGLSGLGGEIFRNYFFSSLPRLPFRTWMLKHVYYPCASLKFEPYADMHLYVTRKMEEILNVDLSGWVDQYALRRYYGEIRMPESNGIVANAHNQLTFYIAPFGEYRNILKAYEATPYIGLSGAFEAAMILRCDPRLAAVDSSYGHPFTHFPFRARAYAAIKGLIPDAVWLAYDTFRIRKRGYQERVDQFKRVCEQRPVMRECVEIMREAVPYLDIDLALRDARSLGNLVYVGYFLRTFEPHLRLS